MNMEIERRRVPASHPLELCSRTRTKRHPDHATERRRRTDGDPDEPPTDIDLVLGFESPSAVSLDGSPKPALLRKARQNQPTERESVQV